MLTQVLRFGLVGAAATVAHFAVAVAAVRALALDPRWANALGFAVAFAVSFVGQWRFTFGGAGTPFARALPAYLLVAGAGFALNAAAYHALLRYTALRYDVALALVLVAVAALTFAASRWWAFRPAESR
ncbi:MAG: GtrA family protein [Burkholderiaceae bacterium]|nr:GtrA family protein [Burkholderiaceae bacterium]MCX7901797.1 GtrA family protein [Burkholderiaceae bacterium]